MNFYKQADQIQDALPFDIFNLRLHLLILKSSMYWENNVLDQMFYLHVGFFRT